jgi:hypothetical protein
VSKQLVHHDLNEQQATTVGRGSASSKRVVHSCRGRGGSSDRRLTWS